MYDRKGITYFLTESDFLNFVNDRMEIYPLLKYLPVKRLVKEFGVRKSNFLYWEPNSLENWLVDNITLYNLDGNLIYKGHSKWTGTGIGCYNMWVDDTHLLRSGNEIYFYKLLLHYGLKFNIDFYIDKPYPNSNMRYDFYFHKKNIYVELAGMTDDEYVQKMQYKHDPNVSCLLWNQKDYELFITEKVCASNN